MVEMAPAECAQYRQVVEGALAFSTGCMARIRSALIRTIRRHEVAVGRPDDGRPCCGARAQWSKPVAIPLRLAAVALCLWTLAAHDLRGGHLLLSCLHALAPLLLLVRRESAVRLLQFCLALGALQWLTTLVRLVGERAEAERPWLRMALILGTVALATAASTLLFRNDAMRQRYRVGARGVP